MSGIAGIAQTHQSATVQKMLVTLRHRGLAGTTVFDSGDVSAGIAWTNSQQEDGLLADQDHVVRDYAGESHFSLAYPWQKSFFLKRDPLGVAPLYYGKTNQGVLCFASEVKALLPLTREITELLPGTSYDGEQVRRYFRLELLDALVDPPEILAVQLKGLLLEAVQRCIKGNKMGSWLSGGLDSSALAAIARPLVSTLHTFSVGFSDSEDILAARQVAQYLKTDHHELLVNEEDLISILPEVIYHLESFDALLVRSSLTNYLVAKISSDFVDEVLSGEGGDELFGGYEYLKSFSLEDLPQELVEISGCLHNTALQRVDRSASAHGIVAHVRFLDPDVVDFALRIPPQYKIKNGEEKWILRAALQGMLPEAILHRPKSKFWQGAGINDRLASYADSKISDSDFLKNTRLPNDWILNSKEEFLYYQIFKEHFGEFENLAWMGRTKGAPVQVY